MSDAESTTPEAQSLFGQRVAVALGVTFLVGFAGVVAFTLRDSGRRGELERFEEVTAVGDTKYFVIPNPIPNPPAAVAQFAGKSWAPVNFEKKEFHDPDMQIAGRDEAHGLSLYRPRAKANTDELFMKIEPGGYVLLHPSGQTRE